MALQLRPYQELGLNLIRSSLGRPLSRVLFYLPTGGGKTVMAEAIIRGAVDKDKRVVFIANRKQLVAQASAHLTRAGIPHGILQGDNTRHLHERVLVCSIDTVHLRGIPDDVGLILIDEAHAVAGSKKYQELLFRYNRVRVVGLSATPFAPGLGKYYDKLKGPLFEDLVIGATICELIDLNALVDVVCYAPSAPDLAGVKTQRSVGGEIDYIEKQLALAVDKPGLVGDIVDHWLKLAQGKQTVVFATTIPHSQHIVAQFQRKGVKAEHLDYHFDDDERAAVLDRFAKGETTVLSNVGLLAEGWDCPQTECMVLARPTKSLIRYIQMVGRVLRPAPGKAHALLLDHSGTVQRLGFPTDDLPLELDDGNPRKSDGGQARKKSEPRPCPSCKYLRPAGEHLCLKCGFAPQRQNDVTVEDGELVKVERRKPLRKESDQHIYSQLLGCAQNKRYDPGWAFHRYKEFTGRMPTGLRQVASTPTAQILGWLKSREIANAKAKEKAQRVALSPAGHRARLAVLRDHLKASKEDEDGDV